MTTEPSAEFDESLRERLVSVRERIARAAGRRGRDPASVTLVAVTKTVGVDTLSALARLGQVDVGENRPADLAAKRAALPAPMRWHMIGHFQRRKVRDGLPSIDVVHSVDSLPLAAALDRAASAAGRVLPVYVQFNVSGEATKGGFGPGDAAEALSSIRAMSALDVRGLMTMAPESDDPETSRPVFRRLGELRDWARDSGYLAQAGLSMGMSGDFEIAVEEGATVVRVGRALLGGSQ